MNNKEVMEVIYEFFKVRTTIMNLSDFDATSEEATELKTTVAALQNEIKNNKNRNDIRVRKLEELLKDLFERMSIDNIAELTDELKKAINEVKSINEENDRLAETYGGHYSFVKTYSDSIINYDVDKSDVEKLLIAVYDNLKDKLIGDTVVIQGKDGFINSVRKAITPDLFKTGLYSKVKGCLSDILNDLYTNIQLFM